MASANSSLNIPSNQSPLLLLNNMSNLMSTKLDSSNYYDMEASDYCCVGCLFHTRKIRLYSTCSSAVLAMVVGKSSSQEVWNTLEERFTSTARSSVLNLKLELQSIKKTGLPKEYAPFASTIRTRDTVLSLEKLTVLLQTKEQSMNEASIEVEVGTHTLEAEVETQALIKASVHLIPHLRATDHITANANNLSPQAPYQGQEQVSIGNGQNLPIQNIDFWGHALVIASNAFRFYLVFVDEFTKFTWHSCSHHLVVSSHESSPISTGQCLITTVSVPTSVTDLTSTHLSPTNTHTPTSNSISLPTGLIDLPSHSPTPTTMPTVSSEIPIPTTAMPDSLPSIFLPHTTATSLPEPISTDISLPNPIPHPMQTRSKSGIFKAKLTYATLVDYIVTELPSYTVASKHPKWCTAMDEKFQALQQQATWSLVPLPTSKNVVGCKWVYKLKHHNDGSIARYKARLVAKGFLQHYGVDFDETFSPIIKPPTVRLILSLAVSLNWPLRQLQGPGLKVLLDSSLFIYKDNKVITYLLLYVADIVLTSNTPTFLDHLIQQLNSVFDLKDLGSLHYFLRLQITKTFSQLYLNQSKYAQDLLKKHNMLDCKPASSPNGPNTRLSLHDGDLLPDPHVYRSMVGALHYLTFTRPDISFAVHQVCQYMSTPTTTHLAAAKRVLRYIRGIFNHGIEFTPGPLHLSSYTDADWAGDPDDSKYRALAIASAELCWVHSLLKDLGIYLTDPPILWCDKVSALAIALNPVFHARTKHIEVDFHFVQERVLQKDLVVKFVSIVDQLADIFSKSLPTHRFLNLRRNLTVTVPKIEGG
uniref:Reverse transcriptase Ty1/copia-type domain-containing protein n=1 Tax=Fagus sylvatica TaxID=28930 RepID=A0A2N9IG27_FAGSY